MKGILRFVLNGDPVEVAVVPSRTLAELLREDLGLPGTKVACGSGDCDNLDAITKKSVVNRRTGATRNGTESSGAAP